MQLAAALTDQLELVFGKSSPHPIQFGDVAIVAIASWQNLHIKFIRKCPKNRAANKAHQVDCFSFSLFCSESKEETAARTPPN